MFWQQVPTESRAPHADFLSAIPITIASGLVALIIVILFGKELTATSLKGARTQVQIRGFQEFMNRVDADRLKRMPPDTFEKFLPYAMALDGLLPAVFARERRTRACQPNPHYKKSARRRAGDRHRVIP